MGGGRQVAPLAPEAVSQTLGRGRVIALGGPRGVDRLDVKPRLEGLLHQQVIVSAQQVPVRLKTGRPAAGTNVGDCCHVDRR